MPLAFSVSCPGKLGDSLPAIARLKQNLCQKENCFVESVGWVHGFVVRLQETSRQSVMALLKAEGCTVDRISEQHYEWPTSTYDMQHQAPWNQSSSHRPASLVDEVTTSQKPQQEALIVSSDPKPVLLSFTNAA